MVEAYLVVSYQPQNLKLRAQLITKFRKIFTRIEPTKKCHHGNKYKPRNIHCLDEINAQAGKISDQVKGIAG
jgi:hypothetical protein